ncbi:MAG TPA: DUF3185 family protein [Planctomycetota bacterium]|nr:DUF3185 family protein [Planctomycetota bacterium]
MAPNRILGILLLVVGCILLALAYSASQSVADQTKHIFTGNFRDRTTFLMIGGAVSAVVGLIALLVPSRKVGWGGGYAP